MQSLSGMSESDYDFYADTVTNNIAKVERDEWFREYEINKIREGIKELNEEYYGHDIYVNLATDDETITVKLNSKTILINILEDDKYEFYKLHKGDYDVRYTIEKLIIFIESKICGYWC